MKRLTLIAAVMISAAPHLYSQQAAAAVPGLDGRGVGAPTACPAIADIPQILHFDKLVFVILAEPKLVAANTADQDALDKLPRQTPLDIKVSDNPRRVADLKAKVLTFLGAAVTDANRQAINMTNVLYATAVCTPKGW